MVGEYMSSALYGINNFVNKINGNVKMYKLVELLNERMKEEEKIGPKHSRFLNYDGINHVFRLNNGCSFCMELVLSKRYGFIKWLVENDKVDLDKYPQVLEYSDLQSLLMILSIDDSPVELLASILK